MPFHRTFYTRPRVGSYIRLATRLGQDTDFRIAMVDLIDQRQWIIWERKDEVGFFLGYLTIGWYDVVLSTRSQLETKICIYAVLRYSCPTTAIFAL